IDHCINIVQQQDEIRKTRINASSICNHEANTLREASATKTPSLRPPHLILAMEIRSIIQWPITIKNNP
ncbi:hypothetical protein, partial [Pseudomonas viridiflava]|uniref:hypothetical protein n=1 Tax=Pseudomonas viridiflava TaxID=33069 RepID=UPI001981AB6A